MKNCIYILFSFFLYFSSFGQCTGSEPIVYLGNDTVLCQGQTLALTASDGYDNYMWSTTSNSQAITVSTPGEYYVSATITSGGTNLVVNGDFENGTTGFISDYISGTGGTWGILSNPGQYAVANTPNDVHSNFYSCMDHTFGDGTGNMYVANGSDIANTIVWSQTISVVPNTNYNFSTWAMSVENTGNPAILQFFVNNVQIGAVFSPSATGCTWSEFYNLWNSGSSTNAVISIKNQNIDGGGNDFALDDISFTSFCTNTDTIIVSFDPTTINAGSDLTFCEYAPLNLVATSNDPSTSFSWNTGEVTADISPSITGTYTVSTITDNGCVITDVVNVIIHTAPEALINTVSQTGVIPLSVEISNSSQNATSYDWNFGNGSVLSTTDLSSVSMLYPNAGIYQVTMVASNANCTDTASLTIITTNEVSLETANVFTPNNDGVNDEFKFKMENISEIDLTIFNRWGHLVHSITNVNDSWNGITDGKEANDGVYFYTYTAKGLQDVNFEGQGFIHLIR